MSPQKLLTIFNNCKYAKYNTAWSSQIVFSNKSKYNNALCINQQAFSNQSKFEWY